MGFKPFAKAKEKAAAKRAEKEQAESRQEQPRQEQPRAAVQEDTSEKRGLFGKTASEKAAEKAARDAAKEPNSWGFGKKRGADEATLAAEQSAGVGVTVTLTGKPTAGPAGYVMSREAYVDKDGKLQDGRTTAELPNTRVGLFKAFRKDGDAVSVEDKKNFNLTSTFDGNGGKQTDAKIKLSNRGAAGEYQLFTTTEVANVPGGREVKTKGDGLLKRMFGKEKEVTVEGRQFTANNFSATGQSKDAPAVLKAEQFVITDKRTGEQLLVDSSELARYRDDKGKRVTEFKGELITEGKRNNHTTRSVTQDADNQFKGSFENRDIHKGPNFWSLFEKGRTQVKLQRSDGDLAVVDTGVRAQAATTKMGAVGFLGLFREKRKVDFEGVRLDGLLDVGVTEHKMITVGVGAAATLGGTGLFASVFVQGGKEAGPEQIMKSFAGKDSTTIAAARRAIGSSETGAPNQRDYAQLVAWRNEHQGVDFNKVVKKTREDLVKETRDTYTPGQKTIRNLSQTDMYYLRHSLGQPEGLSPDSGTMQAVKDLTPRQIRDLVSDGKKEARKEASDFKEAAKGPRYETTDRKDAPLYQGGDVRIGDKVFTAEQVAKAQMKAISGHTIIGDVPTVSTATLVVDKRGNLRAPTRNELSTLGYRATSGSDIVVIDLRSYDPGLGMDGKVTVEVNHLNNHGDKTTRTQVVSVNDQMERQIHHPMLFRKEDPEKPTPTKPTPTSSPTPTTPTPVTPTPVPTPTGSPTPTIPTPPVRPTPTSSPNPGNLDNFFKKVFGGDKVDTTPIPGTGAGSGSNLSESVKEAVLMAMNTPAQQQTGPLNPSAELPKPMEDKKNNIA